MHTYTEREREKTDKRRDRETKTQTDRQTDRQTDKQTDRQTDRQTDSQTDRQTDQLQKQCSHWRLVSIHGSCLNTSPLMRFSRCSVVPDRARAGDRDGRGPERGLHAAGAQRQRSRSAATPRSAAQRARRGIGVLGMELSAGQAKTGKLCRLQGSQVGPSDAHPDRHE